MKQKPNNNKPSPEKGNTSTILHADLEVSHERLIGGKEFPLITQDSPLYVIPTTDNTAPEMGQEAYLLHESPLLSDKKFVLGRNLLKDREMSREAFGVMGYHGLMFFLEPAGNNKTNTFRIEVTKPEKFSRLIKVVQRLRDANEVSQINDLTIFRDTLDLALRVDIYSALLGKTKEAVTKVSQVGGVNNIWKGDGSKDNIVNKHTIIISSNPKIADADDFELAASGEYIDKPDQGTDTFAYRFDVSKLASQFGMNRVTVVATLYLIFHSMNVNYAANMAEQHNLLLHSAGNFKSKFSHVAPVINSIYKGAVKKKVWVAYASLDEQLRISRVSKFLKDNMAKYNIFGSQRPGIDAPFMSMYTTPMFNIFNCVHSDITVLQMVDGGSTHPNKEVVSITEQSNFHSFRIGALVRAFINDILVAVQQRSVTEQVGKDYADLASAILENTASGMVSTDEWTFAREFINFAETSKAQMPATGYSMTVFNDTASFVNLAHIYELVRLASVPGNPSFDQRQNLVVSSYVKDTGSPISTTFLSNGLMKLIPMKPTSVNNDLQIVNVLFPELEDAFGMDFTPVPDVYLFAVTIRFLDGVFLTVNYVEEHGAVIPTAVSNIDSGGEKVLTQAKKDQISRSHFADKRINGTTISDAWVTEEAIYSTQFSSSTYVSTEAAEASEGNILRLE